MKIEEIVSRITKRLMSIKKISAKEDEVKAMAESIFKYIYLFNSVDEFGVRVLDRDFEEIIVLDEFKEFIYPRCVRRDAMNLNMNDLLVRAAEVSKDLSYGDYIDACANFRRLFKSDISTGIVKLSDLKKDVNLADIEAKIDVDGRVQFNGIAFVPIPVNKGIGVFYKKSYLNESAGFRGHHHRQEAWRNQ